MPYFPSAWFTGWIDVGENPENAVPFDGPPFEGIGMEQAVVEPEGLVIPHFANLLASGNFHRSVGCAARIEILSIVT